MDIKGNENTGGSSCFKSAFIHTLISTILIGAIAALLMLALPNWGLLDPVSRSFDSFSFTDLYYSLYRNSDNAKRNDRIVIIDTSHKTRGEIASTIDKLMAYEPATVGIDIIFDRPTGDTLGTQQLQNTVARHSNNLVAITKLLDYNDETQEFGTTSSSALDNELTHRAYSNLKSIGEGGYVRNYTLWRNVAGDTLGSFASVLASRYRVLFGGSAIAPEQVDGIIDFMPQRFNIINADSLHLYADEIMGRIVLLGNVSNEEDVHYTPMGKMNGTIIHAYTIDTLLDRPTHTVSSGWILALEALLLWGFVIVYWLISIACQRRNYKLLMAVVNWIYPVATALLVVCLSGWLFISSHHYVSPILLMAAMAMLPNTVELYMTLKDSFIKNLAWLDSRIKTLIEKIKTHCYEK